MVWTHYENHERTIGALADADLCAILQGMPFVEIATRVRPFSMPRLVPKDVAYIVCLIARGHEADSQPFWVEISWNGQWAGDEATMAESLRVQRTSDPSRAASGPIA